MSKTEIKIENYLKVKKMDGITVIKHQHSNNFFEILILENAILYVMKDSFYFIQTRIPFIKAYLLYNKLKKQ